MNPQTVKIAINYQHKGKNPAGLTSEQTRSFWRKFNGDFVNRTLTVDELINAIASGHAFTAQHNRYREAGNFLQAQHIALDFDTKDERSTFAYLLQDPFIANYCTFLYTTPSHTPEAPKCRAVFVLDKPIRDREKYTLLTAALVKRYGAADEKCRDAVRLFFGSEGCLVERIGKVLPLEAAAVELVEPYRAFLALEQQRREERAKDLCVVGSGDVSAEALNRHLQLLLDRVRLAPEGEKHDTRLRIGRTIGGYVAGGYLSRPEAISILQDAALRNSTKPALALADIEDAIEYGMKDPLYFEVRQRPGNVPELEEVHPPLTDRQKAQVAAVIAKRESISRLSEYWRGYHDGMTAAQRAQWQRIGVPEAAVDLLDLGYCERQVDPETGEILAQNAFTVPFKTMGGDVINIEYRHEDGRVTYANENAPMLYYPEKSDRDLPLLVSADSLTAVTTWLMLGDRYEIAGLPQMPLTTESVPDREIILMLDPETNTAGRGLKAFKNNARFVRLPLPLKQMVQAGITPGKLTSYTNLARGWN